MTQRSLAILLICGSLLLSSCARPTPAPTPTYAQDYLRAIHTGIPTPTPTAAPTPAPTFTPTLQPTPALTVIPVACFMQSKEFLTQLQALFVAFFRPSSTGSGKDTVSQFVSQMQGLRGRLDAMDMPSCASALKLEASAFMDAYIDILRATMAGASDEDVSGKSREAVARATTLQKTWAELIMADASPEDIPARAREVEALKDVLGAQSATVATTVQQQVMAIVQTDTLNIREGPGTSYPVIGRLMNGDAITITGRLDDGSWYQIQVTERGSGWVSSALVKPATSANQIALAPTLTPRPAPTASATPNREATLTAVTRANATATIEGYRQNPPRGGWCDSQQGINVCVGYFGYLYETDYSTAGPGNKFVKLSITVFNHTAKPIHVNPLNVTLVDLDNRAYSYSSVTHSYFATPMGAVDVQPGDNAGGGIMFTIKNDSGPARIVYKSVLGPTVTIDLRRAPNTAEK